MMSLSSGARLGHYDVIALLADRISQGPISLDEALPIAKQIEEASEAPHAGRVIHRKLNPAKVKVCEDGIVKMLDVGNPRQTIADNSNCGARD